MGKCLSYLPYVGNLCIKINSLQYKIINYNFKRKKSAENGIPLPMSDTRLKSTKPSRWTRSTCSNSPTIPMLRMTVTVTVTVKIKINIKIYKRFLILIKKTNKSMTDRKYYDWLNWKNVNTPIAIVSTPYYKYDIKLNNYNTIINFDSLVDLYLVEILE